MSYELLEFQAGMSNKNAHFISPFQHETPITHNS